MDLVLVSTHRWPHGLDESMMVGPVTGECTHPLWEIQRLRRGDLSVPDTHREAWGAGQSSTPSAFTHTISM